VEELKEQAKRNKRSLNNYVELILAKVVEKKPNDETIQALEEALNRKDLKPIADVDEFFRFHLITRNRQPEPTCSLSSVQWLVGSI
jgi:hypothetical protein